MLWPRDWKLWNNFCGGCSSSFQPLSSIPANSVQTNQFSLVFHNQGIPEHPHSLTVNGSFQEIDTTFDIEKHSKARSPWSADNRTKWTDEKRKDPKVLRPTSPEDVQELAREVRLSPIQMIHSTQLTFK
jgi:hypothetical protein